MLLIDESIVIAFILFPTEDGLLIHSSGQKSDIPDLPCFCQSTDAYFRIDSLINDKGEYIQRLLKLCSKSHTLKFQIEKNSFTFLVSPGIENITSCAHKSIFIWKTTLSYLFNQVNVPVQSSKIDIHSDVSTPNTQSDESICRGCGYVSVGWQYPQNQWCKSLTDFITTVQYQMSHPSQKEDHWRELITVHWAEEILQTVGFPIKR